MSLKPKPPHPLGTCPGCSEPLESGDRFCGACGFDLSAASPQPDRPTVPIALPVDWPEPPPRDPQSLTTATQHPGDLPGTDSGGRDLPTIPVRTDEVPPAPGGPAGPAGPASPASQAAGIPGGPPAPSTQGGPADPDGADGPAAPTGPSGPAAPAEPGPSAAPAGPADPAARPAPGAPAAPAPARSSGSGAGAVAAADPGSGAGAASSDDDFTLAAPDPRAALQAEPAQAAPASPPEPVAAARPGDDRKVCVACRAGRVDGDGYCEHCGHAQPRERDHMEQELPAVAAVSDRGLRHHRNEDAFAVAQAVLPDGSPAALAVVCDGVSSATRPDEASSAAAAAARDVLVAALPRGTHPQQAMHEAIVSAAEAVDALAERSSADREHQNAPACTIVGSIVAGGLLIVGWVGDSRAYWVPDDRSSPPARLTEDDSWAAQMVAAGLMSEAQAYADERAHAITGWLGADSYELEPHTAAFKPDRPGVVVVCTDGLWNYAEGAEDMARVMPPDAGERPLHGAQVLVGHALDGGGHDNITVALLPFALPSPGAGSA
ncbi:PP2C family protein-serine/threonine phosphatase [Streptomyces sp. NPDC051921]|uniref:PP2C family protein-serine/threonine phosphatase n=1 Tax=Streptomyces sp. NPDC051921 TaxID=3155806 RepID=UPI0034334F9F